MTRFLKAFRRFFVQHAAALLLLTFSVFTVLFFHIDVVSAAAVGGQEAFEQFGDAVRLSDTSPIIIIARLIRVFLGLTGIILTILVLYAGWLYMVSRGDAAKTGKAKKLLGQAVIGMMIIWFSFSITWFILEKLLSATHGNGSTTTANQYAEPLKGSLGAGIINSHYPIHLATDIPRNTRIFVEFKEPINPASIIDGFVVGQQSGPLKSENIKIFPTEQGRNGALGNNAVVVSVDATSKIFVFRPVALLGDSAKDTNYTVELRSGIEKAAGGSAFTGAYRNGYNWLFTVGTEVDMTPPTVSSVIPRANTKEARNITIEVTFSEAMDPVVTTGIYRTDADRFFNNLEVLYADDDGVDLDTHVEGVFEISNVYRTVSFTTDDACSEDPCGDTIYCLPGGETHLVNLKAATVDVEHAPQAVFFGALPNGITDASGNSLDGNADEKACQGVADIAKCPGGNQDGYNWRFETTDAIEDTVPQIVLTNPEPLQGNISLTEPITALFNTLLKGSTVHSSNVSLWPENFAAERDAWWFFSTKEDLEVGQSRILISHPTLIPPEAGAMSYYPVFNQGIKSAYQICMFPGGFQNTVCQGTVSEELPNCCLMNGNGGASPQACRTITNQPLPPN